MDRFEKVYSQGIIDVIEIWVDKCPQNRRKQLTFLEPRYILFGIWR